MENKVGETRSVAESLVMNKSSSSLCPGIIVVVVRSSRSGMLGECRACQRCMDDASDLFGRPAPENELLRAP